MDAEPSIFIWCEIVCRKCSHTSPGEFTRGAVPRASLKKAARSKGWQFAHGECFCSTDCLREFEAESKDTP